MYLDDANRNQIGKHARYVIKLKITVELHCKIKNVVCFCVRGTRTHPNFVPVSVYIQEILTFRRVKTAVWPPLKVSSGALDLVVAHHVFVFVYSAERTP